MALEFSLFELTFCLALHASYIYNINETVMYRFWEGLRLKRSYLFALRYLMRYNNAD